MFYVYVLRCKDGSFYTGYTNNVEARVKKHNEGGASRYTRNRLPVSLVKTWKFRSKSEAMKAEAAFKKFSRSRKEEKLR